MMASLKAPRDFAVPVRMSADPPKLLSAGAKDNVDTIVELDEREHAKVGPLRWFIERISSVCGTPGYFLFSLAFIGCWIALNLIGKSSGWAHVDEPPFFWLQGIVSSNALLLTISVLIRQGRMAQLAEQRSHLALQINMLTEQKVAKILELIAPIHAAHAETDDHHERHVAELSEPADAEAILSAIKDRE